MEEESCGLFGVRKCGPNGHRIGRKRRGSMGVVGKVVSNGEERLYNIEDVYALSLFSGI